MTGDKAGCGTGESVAHGGLVRIPVYFLPVTGISIYKEKQP